MQGIKMRSITFRGSCCSPGCSMIMLLWFERSGLIHSLREFRLIISSSSTTSCWFGCMFAARSEFLSVCSLGSIHCCELFRPCILESSGVYAASLSWFDRPSPWMLNGTHLSDISPDAVCEASWAVVCRGSHGLGSRESGVCLCNRLCDCIHGM